MWGYILLSLRFQWVRPNRPVRILLSVVGLLGLLATYSIRLGPNAYLGLLSIMAALKPFEMNTHRDRMITLFLAYFIVITSLFQSETLSITLYMFVSVFVTTGALIRINDPDGLFKTDLRLSGTIMAQAIPLMVILFFLFPRMQGSIFGLSQAPAGRTGFSDRLSPGNISRLVENNDIAFRAEFEGDTPRAEALYWRGIVFHEFDGRNWHRLNQVPAVQQLPKGQTAINYRISMEPHGQRWLFALDRPGEHPRWSRMQADYVIRNMRPVNRKKYYDMTSFPKPQKGAAWGVAAARQLPGNGNSRARELAARFEAAADSADEIVSQAMAYLKNNDFVYTLEPPVLGRNPVDDFLFQSRRGYCEHYASAFAFLMRAAGVPARIVGGYLGGEVNPFGDYLIVRQSDAHAWVEVWTEAGGWSRVDPTGVVAPARLTEGASGALQGGGSSGGFGLGWIQQLQLGWDAISSGWEAWFDQYSYLEQKALLERLGIRMGSWRGPLTVFLLVCGTILFIVGLYIFFQVRPATMEKDRVRECYERFCRKLEKAGISRPPDKGPADFASQIVRERPDLRPEVDEIIKVYIWLRYRERHDPDMEKHFCRLVGKSRPRKKK
jgi:transglutaminase-like putative cysteine protease